MSAPSLTVYQNGVNQVSGDGLNTFVQSSDSVTTLRGFIGTPGMEIELQGFSLPGDGGQGPFYWNASSTATDDSGVTVVKPNASTTGRWIRIGSVAGQNSIIQTTAVGTNSIALSALSGQTVITAYANYQLFGFVAAATSSGAVTASVNLVGSLKVFRTDGVQANSGDIVSGIYYIIVYNSVLDSSAGGFQLISNTLNNLTFTGATISPNLNVTGSTIPANGIYLSAANTVAISSRSLPILSLNNLSSAVNYFQMVGQPSLGSPGLYTIGSDSNIGMNLYSKGSGGVSFYTDGQGTPRLQFIITNTSTAVNYLQASGATTGNSPTLSALGSDSNVSLTLLPQGTANVQVGGSTSQGMVIGTGALATGATAGFLQIPSSVGAATGAVSAAYAGAVCIHYDSSANKIMVRSGGTWRSTAALT